MLTGIRVVVCLGGLAAALGAQTPQLRKEYIRLGRRIIAIESPAASLAITTSSLPAATVGAAYSYTLSAAGGSGGYQWSITGGVMPGGMTLSTGGVLSGTPLSYGTGDLTFQVRDSPSVTYSGTLSFVIQANGTDGAAVHSVTVPASVSPGQQFTAQAVMKNSGTTTWVRYAADPAHGLQAYSHVGSIRFL